MAKAANPGKGAAFNSTTHRALNACEYYNAITIKNKAFNRARKARSLPELTGNAPKSRKVKSFQIGTGCPDPLRYG